VLVVGSPMAFAIAAHLTVFPALVALYWIGRGEVGYVVGFFGWLVGLSIVQAFFDPVSWNAYWNSLTLNPLGAAQNISPFAQSPTGWVVLVAFGIFIALAFARTKYGWPI